MKKRRESQCDKLKMILISSIVVLAILMLLVLVQVFFLGARDGRTIKEIECVKDSDCIIVRGSCCSCEEGGSPVCLSKGSLGEYTQLMKCYNPQGCLNVDCGKIGCGCVNNKCVGYPA